MQRLRFLMLLAVWAGLALAEQPAGFNGCHVQGALDPMGRIHLVYANAEWNDLYHRTYDDGVWSEPVYLANSSPMWLLFCSPTLAVGSDGIPQVVYGRETGNYPNDLDLFTIAKATDTACTTWSYQTVGYDGYRRCQTDMALDEGNQAHIVYQMTPKSTPYWHRIIYRRPDGSEVIIRHTSEPNRCFRPRIAYKNGMVHIAWYQNNSNGVNIFYAAAPPYGNFSPSQITNVGNGRCVETPAMAIHPNGTVQIVYLVSDWSGSHPYYLGLYLTQPGWTNGVLLDNTSCSLNEQNEDYMAPSIAFDSAGNRYVGWAHHTLNKHFCKKNDEARTEFSPFGHIDVWTYGQNAYYARTNGSPGPIYWHQLAGSGANTPPSLTMLTPPSSNAEANASYTLSWTDSDPDNNAVIALFYDTNSSGFDGTAIVGAQSIQEDPDGAGDQFAWNVSGLPDNARYWVYGTINDGTNPVAMSYSPGSLFVNHDNDPPSIALTAPASPDTVGGGTFEIAWTDDDPDDDASISLFYSSVDAPNESTLIVSGLSEDDAGDSHPWDISSMPPGTYRIYARIFDGQYIGYSHSTGTVTVLTSITFSPTDDASVYRDWEPNLPHGDRPDLDVGADDTGAPDEMAFFRFEVTGLEYGVVRAYLRVHCVAEGGGGGAHSVSGTTWTEGTLTWNNKPGMGASPVSSIPWVYAGNWYAYEVTSLILGNGTYALALRSTEPDGSHFASKEYETTSLRPYLEVLMGGEIPDLPPTAQIDSLIPNPVVQGFHSAVGFYGSGWDNDESGQSITAWQWMSSLNGQIGTTASFTRSPTSLAVGTHTITLTAQDDESVWSPADTAYLDVRAPDTSAPTWPNGMGLLGVEDLANGGSVKLYWNAAHDANPPIRYNVYHSASSPAFSGTCLSDVAWAPGLDFACTFVVSGLPVEAPRYFGVRAEDLVGNEDANTVELVCTPSENGPPSFVEGPSVSDVTYSSALVSWVTDEPTTGIVGFWTGPGDSTAADDTSMDTDHAVRLTGLLADTTYYYRVYATDSSQNQIQSAVSSFSTTGLPTYSYSPSDDAYVSNAEPDANFGGSTLLLVNAGQISYVRFTVPDLGEVASVSLQITAATSGDTVTVWPVSSADWEEETITWNTRPFLGGNPVGGIPEQDPAQTCSVDVSSMITMPGTYSLALNAPPTRGGAFYAKEHSTAAQRPSLLVTFLGDVIPPSTVSGLTCDPAGLGLLLSWQPAADNVGVEGYRIYRGATPYFDPLPRSLIGTTGNTQYTDVGAVGDPEVDHFYVVTAFDAAGNESNPSHRVGEKEYELTD